MPRQHRLDALPENIHWGFHDAALPPVLRVASGDTVELTSWAAADPEDLPPDPSLVQQGHREAMEKCTKLGASHMLTGPVFVEGAEPGNVLQIDILEVKLIDCWGYVGMLPLRGTLPGEFDRSVIKHPEIDVQRRSARLP